LVALALEAIQPHTLNLDRLSNGGYSTDDLNLGVEVAYRPDAEVIKGKPVNLGCLECVGCKRIVTDLKDFRSQSGAVPQL
jgi:hypothetical protein